MLARPHQTNFRLSDAERARLDGLSRHYGLASGEVLRMLVKREADALGVVVPTKRGRAA